MSGLETVTIYIGAAVVKGAIKLWLGNRQIAADASASAIDEIAARLTSVTDQRRAKRLYQQMEEVVASRIEPLVEVEFRNLPENDREAAIIAVGQVFDQARLTHDDLFAADLDAGYLHRYLEAEFPNKARDAGLSADGRELYDRLMRECCAYIIEITRTLPHFGVESLTVILRRESEILDQVRKVLDQMPQRRSARDFEADYRQQVLNILDHVELFGVTFTEISPRYPLSIAYISLELETNQHIRPSGEAFKDDDMERSTASLDTSAETVLAQHPRLFVRGEAGSGKTTLLQWAAVRCAARDGAGPFGGQSELVPFFIPLRRYSDGQLPTPEAFLTDVGRHIADEMPKGWVHERLRSGGAVVLVDGVDELPDERREEVRTWLRELIATFPNARYIVTSRPAAVDPYWLGSEDFTVAEFLPMNPANVRSFIHRWHDAVAALSREVARREELARFEGKLVEQLAGRRALSRLATNPLLCALLCSLHADRQGHLPANRMQLYQIALDMLLERRDTERNIEPMRGLSLLEKVLLLQDLAFWLLRNGWSDVDVGRVLERLRNRLELMPQVGQTPDRVLGYLLERSGVLREPVVGRVDFVHRTFQEYLAAKAAIEDDSVGFLVQQAHLDQWQDVVVMAAGHAPRRAREELLRGVLSRGDAEPANRYRLHLLAVACLETSPELDRTLRLAIEDRTASLLPPRSYGAAKALGAAGEFVIDLLWRARPRTGREVGATIRAAAEVGSDSALRVIARYGRDERLEVVRELLAAWPNFDTEQYAMLVLADSPLLYSELVLDDPDLLPGCRYLRNLRALQCSFRSGFGTLDYLDDLHLTAFGISDPKLQDLSQLSGRQLTKLSINYMGRMKTLAPVGQIDGLKALTLSSWDFGPDTALLGTLGPANLMSLSLEGFLGVQSIHELSMFSGLQELSLTGFPALETLHGIERWSGTLRHLNLSDMRPIDLSSAGALERLEMLRVFQQATSVFPDLSFIRSSERSPNVLIVGAPDMDVDLSAFSQMQDLLVNVWLGAGELTGAETLGDRSFVQVARYARRQSTRVRVRWKGPRADENLVLPF